MWYLVAALIYFSMFIGVAIWLEKNMPCTLPFKAALTVLFVAAWTLPAMAAEVIPAHTAVPPSTFGAALQVFLSGTVFPLLGSFVLGLVSLLLTRLGTKYKVQALTEENNFLFRLAAQGVALAEEWAAKRASATTRLTGMEKMDIAIAHILTYAPKVSTKQAEDIVHSMLAQIPGAGATGEAVTLLPQEGGYSIPAPGLEVIAGELAPAQPAAP